MGLNIKKIKITDITPTSYNPRKIEKNQYDKLAQSIQEFGLVDPIIVNLKNNNIIGGHQRFDYLYNHNKDSSLNLIELGDIGWVFTDVDLKIKDDAHEKALNLALNRISGEWKIDELNNILDELAEYNLDGLTGFDYSLDDFEYEYVEIDDDEDDIEFEELSDDESDYEYEPSISENQTTSESEPFYEPTKSDITPKNTIYRNNNNIIYYGEENEKTIKELLKQKQKSTEYNIENLKLIKSIDISLNYYITDSEETIRLLLEDPNTHRIG